MDELLNVTMPGGTLRVVRTEDGQPVASMIPPDGPGSGVILEPVQVAQLYAGLAGWLVETYPDPEIPGRPA